MEGVIDEISVDDLQKLVIDLKNQLIKKDDVIKSLYDKITDIKRTISYLIEKDDLVYNSKHELEMIFDASDDYIVILDKYHKIKRANMLFCNLVNKIPTEIIGTKFTDYFDIDIDIDVPQNKFIETTLYSKIFKKNFLVKSRKLPKSFEPLVYLHITREIKKDDEC